MPGGPTGEGEAGTGHDGVYDISGVWVIGSTKRYETALGATRTVPHMSPLEISPWLVEPTAPEAHPQFKQ